MLCHGLLGSYQLQIQTAVCGGMLLLVSEIQAKCIT